MTRRAFLGADIARTQGQQEWHIAHIRATWDSGTKGYGHEWLMKVANFRRYAP